MYHHSGRPLQDRESSQEHSTELARLTIHGEKDEPTTTGASQPGPPPLATITTDRHTFPHPRHPTATHPTLNLQHRESNLRSDPKTSSSSCLPSRSSTPVSASTPLFRQPTTTATYFTGALTAASQMNQNTDRLLVAYNQRERTPRSSTSEVDLRRPLQSSGSPPTQSRALLPHLDPERSTLPRYEARGGSSRTSPFYASSSSDLLSVASLDEDETSVEKSSPEPTASTSGTTAEIKPWDPYVEKLGVSKYRCTYTPPGGEPCGQRGDKRHLVTRHIKAVHLNIRPFECSYCNRRFPSNSGLETHVNTHTGETPYECPFCQRGFADRAGLHRHKVKEHDYQPRSRRSKAVFMPPAIG